MRFNQLTLTQEELGTGELETIDPADPWNITVPAEAEDAVTELTEDAATVDAVDDGIDETANAVDTLSDVQEVIEEGGNDTVTPLEVAAVQSTVESIYSRLGFERVVSTMESLSGTPSRATVVATLEAEKSGILEKMKAGFKAALGAIMQFITGLVKNTWVLDKYLKYVAGKVKAIPRGATPSASAMPESAAAMSVNGDASSASVEPMYLTALGLLKVSARFIEQMNKFNFNFNASEAEDLPTVNSFNLTPKDVPTRGEAPDGSAQLGFLTNDRCFSQKSELDFTWKSTHAAQVRKSLHAQTAVVPSVQQMEDLLKKAGDIITGLKAVESKRNRIKNGVARIISEIVAMFATYGSIVSKDAKKQRNFQWEMSWIRRALNKGLSSYLLEPFKTAKAFIDYAKHGTKYYSSDAEEDAPSSGLLLEGPKEKATRVEGEVLDREGDNPSAPKFDRFGKRIFRN